MNYWLIKFAPFRYSWQDMLRNGKFEIYSVRNAQARNNLKVMKLGIDKKANLKTLGKSDDYLALYGMK